MKKTTTKATIIFVCLIAAVVGYYAYLSNRAQSTKAGADLSAVELVLSRDMENDYPATPKEVIKYYNEIMKCFYNEECDEGQIDDLGRRARVLFDDELLAANELGGYLMRLRRDIQEYKDHNRRISYTNVGASTSVDFFEEDGYSFARIPCGYTISEAGKPYPSNQIYLLRRDENKRWKIYGWKDIEELEGYESAEGSEDSEE